MNQSVEGRRIALLLRFHASAFMNLTHAYPLKVAIIKTRVLLLSIVPVLIAPSACPVQQGSISELAT